jgi:hypothetical protein
MRPGYPRLIATHDKTSLGEIATAWMLPGLHHSADRQRHQP